MSYIPTFRGTVSTGGLLTLAPEEARRRTVYLHRLAGKAVTVRITIAKAKRSLDQNAWWWGVYLPIVADALGYDKHEHDDLHYALVAKCFGTHTDKMTHQEVPNVRSSSLTTAQFSDLMEWAVRFAATEWGVAVPLPNEGETA